MSETEVKTFSLAEIAKNNSNQSSWIIIHNNVYDVTPFLNEVSAFFWGFFLLGSRYRMIFERSLAVEVSHSALLRLLCVCVLK